MDPTHTFLNNAATTLLLHDHVQPSIEVFRDVVSHVRLALQTGNVSPAHQAVSDATFQMARAGCTIDTAPPATSGVPVRVTVETISTDELLALARQNNITATDELTRRLTLPLSITAIRLVVPTAGDSSTNYRIADFRTRMDLTAAIVLYNLGTAHEVFAVRLYAAATQQPPSDNNNVTSPPFDPNIALNDARGHLEASQSLYRMVDALLEVHQRGAGGGMTTYHHEHHRHHSPQQRATTQALVLTLRVVVLVALHRGNQETSLFHTTLQGIKRELAQLGSGVDPRCSRGRVMNTPAAA